MQGQGGRAPWDKPRTCERCIRMATVYSRFISIILLVLSAAVLVFGVLLYRNLGESLEEIDLRSPALATIVFGACMFAFAVTGMLGDYFESGFLRLIFVVGSLFITIGVMAAGVALLSYTEYLENVGANNLQFALEEKILTYELAVFQECCDPDNDPPESCDENGNKFPCYTDVDLFNKFVGLIGDNTCGILGNVNIDGNRLVGEEPGDCAGQNDRDFVEMISGFIEGNIRILGIINLVLAVVMLLLTMASCALLWTGEIKAYDRERKQKKLEGDAGSDITDH